MLTLLLLFATADNYAFGPTGHRVVGRIAENHLTSQARRAVKQIMGSESLPEAATWPDEVRSDPKYDGTAPWHYVTIEDGETYKPSPKGDVIEAIQRFKVQLKDPSASQEDQVIAIRWLVHLVGDIHQPLHAGRGADLGGNKIETQWFGKKTNIHAVWDAGLIESTQLSYSELAEFIDTIPASKVRQWQHSTVLDWAQESIGYRDQAYELPEQNINGSYKYAYKNVPLVNQRLVQAGVRLADLLNSIFSEGAARAAMPLARAPAAATSKARSAQTAARAARKSTTVEKPSEDDVLALASLGGTLWTQQAEEYRALSISAYRQAQRMLDRALADKTWTALPETEPRSAEAEAALAARPPAIILDVDETVLDNSPYQARLITEGEKYNSLTWNRWVAARRAKAIPGAVKFIDYARQRRVAIFYVTNRDYRGDLDKNGNNTIEPDEKDQILEPYTIENLRAVGLLPQEGISDEDSLLLRHEREGWESDKIARRNLIAKDYRVLLLLGDSLGDFTTYHGGSYYKLDKHARRQELRKHQPRWGRSWIVIPNSTYGAWLPQTHQERFEVLDVWDGTLCRQAVGVTR